MARLRASDTGSRYGLPEPWEQSPGHLGALAVQGQGGDDGWQWAQEGLERCVFSQHFQSGLSSSTSLEPSGTVLLG